MRICSGVGVFSLSLSGWFTSGVGRFAVGERDRASARNLTVESGRCSLHILAEGEGEMDGLQVG